jgi:hypothetical protein
MAMKIYKHNKKKRYARGNHKGAVRKEKKDIEQNE